MTALTYGTFSFDTLDGSAAPSRTITYGHDDAGGFATTEKHSIKIAGHIIGIGATTDLLQADITTKMQSLLDLADGTTDTPVALAFAENDGGVAWSYDGAGGTTDNPTAYGVKVANIDLPDGPAAHVTNHPFAVTFEAEVEPQNCRNQPENGIHWLKYTVGHSVKFGLIDTISISGTLRLCDGFDCDTIIAQLLAGRFTDHVRDILARTSGPIGSLLPTSESHTEQDPTQDEPRLCAFSFTWGERSGGSSPPPTTSSGVALRTTANWSVINNLVTLTVTGVYSWLAGGSRADAVGDAEDFAGISVSDFLHSQTDRGGGPDGWLQETEQLAFDEIAKTVRATRTYFFNWVHDSSVVEYEESVTFSVGQQRTSATVLTFKVGQTEPPLPYVQRAGRGPSTVRVQWRIVTNDQFVAVPKRLQEDDNVMLVDAFDTGAIQRKLHVPTPQKQNWFQTTGTQTYLIRDPGGVPGGAGSPITVPISDLFDALGSGAGGATVLRFS